MLVREPKFDDRDEVFRIAKMCNYELPYLIQCRAVVADDNGLVGLGMIKPIFEGVVMLDQNTNQFRKSVALRLLMDECLIRCKSQLIDSLYVFVHDDNFEAVLKNHFKFVDSKGKTLFLDLEKLNG